MEHLSYFDEEYNLAIKVAWNHQRKICPYVIVDGRYTQAVTVYHSLRWDLNEAMGMVMYLQNTPQPPPIVMASMYKAFIIQYTKCFTQAKGGKTRLDPNSVFKGQKELLKVHNQVMDIRNKYIAHADESTYDNGAMVIYLNPDEKNEVIHSIVYTSMKLFDHTILLQYYIRICKCALEFVNVKLEKLKPSHMEEVNAMDIKDLYKKSKTPPTKNRP